MHIVASQFGALPRAAMATVKLAAVFLLGAAGVWSESSEAMSSAHNLLSGWTAQCVASVLHVLLCDVYRDGAVVGVGGYRLSVEPECNFVPVLVLASVAILVGRSRPCGGILAALLILPILWSVNVLRISIVGFAGSFSHSAAFWLHEIAFPLATGLAAIYFWSLWLRHELSD